MELIEKVKKICKNLTIDGICLKDWDCPNILECLTQYDNLMYGPAKKIMTIKEINKASRLDNSDKRHWNNGGGLNR